MFLEELATVVLLISVVLSTMLFGVEVFIKRRGLTGQGTGFIFSVIAVPLFIIAFCDKLPGRPLSPRDFLLILPGVTHADAEFSSSAVILCALIVTYALRLGIYTRLFIIPALTLSEVEYHAQEQVEQRANDLSAPVLAYLTLALVVTANLAGAYGLSGVAGTVVCIALLFIYFGSRFLRLLKHSLIWLAVQFRITVRQFWLLASAIVVRVIYVIGVLERWRRQPQPGDERFFENLTRQLHQSQRKARLRIARERELLRNLGA